MIVGLTSGCFDLIHFGHIHYLQRCRQLCDRLIVAIDSDAMVRAVKGPARPIIPELERWELINSLSFVETAFILQDLNELTRVALTFNVRKVFKHEGFRQMDNVVGVKGTQAELVIVPDIPGMVSTSTIVERIRTRMLPGGQ